LEEVPPPRVSPNKSNGYKQIEKQLLLKSCIHWGYS
jgi:hypothetical protein